MKKIKGDKPVFGLSVKFADGIDFSEMEGKMTHIALGTRNTSVPMIVTATSSEAKKSGSDGIFALCSEKCGTKMKAAISEELAFKEMKDISLG